MRLRFAIALLLCTACSHTPVVDPVVNNPNPHTRRPSDADDEASPPKAPMVDAIPLTLYSWSNNASVLTNPASLQANVESKLKHSEECIAQISKTKSDKEIEGCEGNGITAGPGIYTVDNPFVSHDYGQILQIYTLTPGRKNVAMITGTLSVPAGGGNLSRFYTGDLSIDAIVYDFRYDGMSGRALTIRNHRATDETKVRAVDARPLKWNPMKTHRSHACTAQSTPSEVITYWADQLDFFAITYVPSNAPSDKGFVSGGQLTEAGAAAAIAGDFAQRSDVDMTLLLAKINSITKDEPLSLHECQNFGSMTLRSCMTTRLYNSLVGNMGTSREPTGAWDLETTKKILAATKVATKQYLESSQTNEELMSALFKQYLTDKTQTERAVEAYNCMNVVRNEVKAKSLQTIGPDPQ